MMPPNPSAYAVVPIHHNAAYGPPDPLRGAGGNVPAGLGEITRRWQLRAVQLCYCESAASYHQYLFRTPAARYTLHCRIV